MSYKPTGYSTVSPYLLVADAEAALGFMETVFGAERLRVEPRKDGPGIAHAEARIDDTVVMMGEMPDATSAHVHVYRADVDDCFTRAIGAGGKVVQPAAEQPDGDYRGGVADPTGTVWWISSQQG
ncbi:VOC family protein [Paracoccus sp. S1E-3]|uniref:VOC family protein n=1 Tax=Paracoccus sp. S1E-3 TaxID=2756130 RepID=UPI0015EFC0FA|nr:VOC family protein [Paracoccus sp. S1E-3]MBA4492512.1 VOC family protein [Paracoccus sp. S1E-3]